MLIFRQLLWRVVGVSGQTYSRTTHKIELSAVNDKNLDCFSSSGRNNLGSIHLKLLSIYNLFLYLNSIQFSQITDSFYIQHLFSMAIFLLFLSKHFQLSILKS